MAAATGERPTFAQAFASEGAATESPTVTTSAETSTPDSASASATETPGATDQTADHASTEEGPIPLERHKKILDGVYKERDDAKQQLEGWKAFEWAKQVDQKALNEAVRIGQLYTTDRAGYIRSLLAEANADPDLGPIVRSEVARILGTRPKGSVEPEPDLKPDIPVYDAQGNLVAQTFGAERVQQIVQHAIAKAMTEQVQPIKQEFETRKQQEQRDTLEREQRDYLKTESTRIRTAVQKLPNAEKHWDAIIAKARTYSEDIPVGEALRDAYLEVVLPTLNQKATAEVLDNLKTKAAAGSVNPSGAVVASTKRPASFHDPALKW